MFFSLEIHEQINLVASCVILRVCGVSGTNWEHFRLILDRNTVQSISIGSVTTLARPLRSPLDASMSIVQYLVAIHEKNISSYLVCPSADIRSVLKSYVGYCPPPLKNNAKTGTL